MPRYRLTLAYDGTDYEGWQVQPAARTIQRELESALARMAKQPVRAVGASRTDAGVHARGQVAHCQLENYIPPAGLQRGLNSILPEDIRVLEAAEAPAGFHARREARSKTYRYCIDRQAVPSPFRIRYAVHHPQALDRAALDGAARLLLGRKDFAALAASSGETRTTVREVFASGFLEEGGELVYEVAASGFLHHMVRNLVGTLLEVGRGRRNPGSIETLLQTRDRRLAGPTAPARGLHLVRVDYSKDFD